MLASSARYLSVLCPDSDDMVMLCLPSRLNISIFKRKTVCPDPDDIQSPYPAHAHLVLGPASPHAYMYLQDVTASHPALLLAKQSDSPVLPSRRAHASWTLRLDTKVAAHHVNPASLSSTAGSSACFSVRVFSVTTGGVYHWAPGSVGQQHGNTSHKD